MRSMLLATLLALPAAVATRAGAEGATPDGGAFPLRVKVGGVALICSTGTIQCPAGAPLCDDPAVVRPEMTPRDGLGFRGLAPGETLCSAGANGGQGLRRVYRITVER